VNGYIILILTIFKGVVIMAATVNGHPNIVDDFHVMESFISEDSRSFFIEMTDNDTDAKGCSCTTGCSILLSSLRQSVSNYSNNNTDNDPGG
jgi:hypothetical protein